jgi:hypothetical protein
MYYILPHSAVSSKWHVKGILDLSFQELTTSKYKVLHILLIVKIHQHTPEAIKCGLYGLLLMKENYAEERDHHFTLSKYTAIDN